MRILDPTTIGEKNAPSNKPVFLYTIYDYDGASTNLNFAAFDGDVIFDGVTYYKFPIRHEPVSENSQGQIDSVRISVANINRVIQSYLEQYDLNGKRVDIKLVWANQLSDAAAVVTDTLYIDSYVATATVVEFTLSTKFDILEVDVPQRKYTRNYCQWKFKSDECGYAGGESECNKTKQRCKELSNYPRFGGFPSIPPQKIFIQ